MTGDQVAASVMLAFIGILPYFRIWWKWVDHFSDIYPPLVFPREHILFARWWCALWCSPLVINLLLRAIL